MTQGAGRKQRIIPFQGDFPAMGDTRQELLSFQEHRHDGAGLTYVYPVLSRRAGGLSIGVNLNVNRACNWTCVYCQVENLRRGGPPPVDLALLEREMTDFLRGVVAGDYLERHLPQGFRRLADIAFSGEGEPTSAAEFRETVAVVGAALARFGLQGKVPLRLITNGSLTHRAEVQEGLLQLAALAGEVWFKLDRADAKGRWQTNATRQSAEQAYVNLRACAERVPTWLQTCWFLHEGRPPDMEACAAYLAFVKKAAPLIQGVRLYGLARASRQVGAEALAPLPVADLEAWGARIRADTGVLVWVSP
ncbi:MAG: radical SAM protein [Zoogloeaceae bacterium]|jgi:wyosine [tRNA(Phe)-imidazoG37] synthetase (radical SAM superfamily)|nr:radical SAM protein [Zoogloeaceae bacterium]